MNPAWPRGINLAAIRPAVNFANAHATVPGQTWGPRTIPDWQLVYVLEGEAELELGGGRYRLRAHDCAYYGPGDAHRLISSLHAPFTFCSIHFCWDADSPVPVHPLRGIDEGQPSQPGPGARADMIQVDGHEPVAIPVVGHYQGRGIEELFLDIVHEYQNEATGYAISLRGLMLQLLARLVREIGHQELPDDLRAKIVPALRVIEEQPEQLFPSTELASLCGYHPTYFARVFQQATGATPRQFQIKRRIDRAKHLLVMRHSIEEVAEQLGYATIHYFSRQFKACTGLTPTEFRSRHAEL